MAFTLFTPTFHPQADREAVLLALTSQAALGRDACRSSSGSGAAGGGGLHPELRARGLLLEAEGGWLHRVTSAWQQARVSNFDYLLYLNMAAGTTCKLPPVGVIQ